LSHEIPLSLGAEAVLAAERNTGDADSRVVRGIVCPAGVGEHITRGKIASETGRSRVWPVGACPRSASGRRGAEADDARTREVGLRHSSGEAGEQSGAIRRGAGGAKGGDQGECKLAKHGPDSAPGNRVTGAGAHTLHCCRGATFGPEVGAVCGKAARPDLCGGRGAILVPTATGRGVAIDGTASIPPCPRFTDTRPDRRAHPRGQRRTTSGCIKRSCGAAAL
jgi:hypothetical protein